MATREKTRKVAFGVSTWLVALFALSVAFASPASAGLVRTGGWESEGGPRPFNLSSVAVDVDGNAYVSDYGMTRIVRIDSDGNADLNWGTGTPGSSYPANPVDLTVDDDGNVYALDMEGKKVRKYSPSGNLLTSWPVNGPQFDGDWSIVWESGKVWVLTVDKVSGFEPDGTPVSLPDGAFAFTSIPNDVTPEIAGDGDGHLVIASADWIAQGSSATKSIYRFDTDGTLLSKWTAPAKVTHVRMDVGDYYYVSAYYSLAVDPSGNIWVSTSDADYPFKKIDASGLQPGGAGDSNSGGSLTIDGEGRFWTIGSDPDHPASDQARRAESDGSDLKTWGMSDFPDYADQVWPGSFKWINDFSVDADGNVAILDLGYHRVKIFNSDGDFLRGFEVPEEIGSQGDYVARVDLEDDGTVEVYDGYTGKLRRFDSSGSPEGESTLDVSGTVRAMDRTSDGGHLVVSGSGTVTRFDQDGQESGSWTLTRDLAAFVPVGIVQGSGGDVYVSSPDFIDRYSASGEHIGTWSLRDEECAEEWSDGFVDLAVDSSGNVYGTASLGAWVGWTKLYAFDPDLNLIWSDNMDQGWGIAFKVAPDGSFLTAGRGINRISHVGPDDPGLVKTCRAKPEKFKLLGVRYGKKRLWAKVRVHVPEAGLLRISGPKVISRSVTSTGAGDYALVVKAKRRYVKRAHPRRKLKLKVRVSFEGQSGSISRNITVSLKGKRRGHHG